MDTKELLDSLDVGVLAMAPDWTIAEWSAARHASPRCRRTAWWVGAFGLVSRRQRALSSNGCWQRSSPTASRAPSSRPPGRPRSRGTVLEMRVSRGPGDQLALSFRPVHEGARAESPRGAALSALEAERRLYSATVHLFAHAAFVLTRMARSSREPRGQR